MVEMIVKALKFADSKAIDLVASIISRVKIVDLTDREMELIRELMKDPYYQSDE